jgi:peroxiredoxin
MHLSATWLRYPLLLVVLVCLLGGRPEAPADRVEGAAHDFTLRDAAGRPFALRDLKGKKAAVVVFLSFECPVSTGYAPALAELASAYRGRDVAFVGVSSGEEPAARVERLATEYGLPFPVYRDERGAAADALGAEITPQVVLLDGDLVPRYRGRIDDRYAARLKPNAHVGRQDLREALDELLAGKPVSEPQTRAVGCTIPRPRPASSGAVAVTYYRDVLPILQTHCQECHRPGEVAPFALMTYRQAVNWADDVKEFTRSRKMPPWKATEGLPMHD